MPRSFDYYSPRISRLATDMQARRRQTEEEEEKRRKERERLAKIEANRQRLRTVERQQPQAQSIPITAPPPVAAPRPALRIPETIAAPGTGVPITSFNRPSPTPPQVDRFGNPRNPIDRRSTIRQATAEVVGQGPTPTFNPQGVANSRIRRNAEIAESAARRRREESIAGRTISADRAGFTSTLRDFEGKQPDPVSRFKEMLEEFGPEATGSARGHVTANGVPTSMIALQRVVNAGFGDLLDTITTRVELMQFLESATGTEAVISDDRDKLTSSFFTSGIIGSGEVDFDTAMSVVNSRTKTKKLASQAVEQVTKRFLEPGGEFIGGRLFESGLGSPFGPSPFGEKREGALAAIPKGHDPIETVKLAFEGAFRSGENREAFEEALADVGLPARIAGGILLGPENLIPGLGITKVDDVAKLVKALLGGPKTIRESGLAMNFLGAARKYADEVVAALPESARAGARALGEDLAPAERIAAKVADERPPTVGKAQFDETGKRVDIDTFQTETELQGFRAEQGALDLAPAADDTPAVRAAKDRVARNPTSREATPAGKADDALIRAEEPPPAAAEKFDVAKQRDEAGDVIEAATGPTPTSDGFLLKTGKDVPREKTVAALERMTVQIRNLQGRIAKAKPKKVTALRVKLVELTRKEAKLQATLDIDDIANSGRSLDEIDRLLKAERDDLRQTLVNNPETRATDARSASKTIGSTPEERLPFGDPQRKFLETGGKATGPSLRGARKATEGLEVPLGKGKRAFLGEEAMDVREQEFSRFIDDVVPEPAATAPTEPVPPVPEAAAGGGGRPPREPPPPPREPPLEPPERPPDDFVPTDRPDEADAAKFRARWQKAQSASGKKKIENQWLEANGLERVNMGSGWGGQTAEDTVRAAPKKQLDNLLAELRGETTALGPRRPADITEPPTAERLLGPGTREERAALPPGERPKELPAGARPEGEGAFEDVDDLLRTIQSERVAEIAGREAPETVDDVIANLRRHLDDHPDDGVARSALDAAQIRRDKFEIRNFQGRQISDPDVTLLPGEVTANPRAVRRRAAAAAEEARVATEKQGPGTIRTHEGVWIPKTEHDPPHLREVERRSAPLPAEVRAALAADPPGTRTTLESYEEVEKFWEGKFLDNWWRSFSEGVSGLFHGMSAKSKGLTEAVARAMVVSDLYKTGQKTKMRALIYDVMGRNRKILGLRNGVAHNVKPKDGAEIPGGLRQGGASRRFTEAFTGGTEDTLAQRLDHIAEHPEKYVMTGEQEAAMQEFADVFEMVLRAEQRAGVDVSEVLGPYWARTIVGSPPGSKLETAVKSHLSKLGTNPPHSKGRFFGDIEELYGAGFRAGDPTSSLLGRVESGVDAIANAHTIRKIEKLGFKPSELLELNHNDVLDNVRDLKEAFKLARRAATRKGATEADRHALIAAEGALDVATKQLRAVKGRIKDSATLLYGRVVSPEVNEAFSRFVTQSGEEGWIDDVLQLARANMVWGDDSALGIQNWTMIWSNPLGWIESAGIGLQSMFFDPWSFVTREFDVIERGNKFLAFVLPEELLLREGGRLSQKFSRLPGVRQSQRAFEWTIFAGMVKRWKGMEASAKNIDELIELAATNRAMAGVTFTPGLTTSEAKIIAKTFFAGRYFASTLNVFKIAMKGGRAGNEARKILGLSFGGALTTTAGIHMMFNDGKLPNFTHPNRPGFLGAKVGGTFIYPLGPFQPMFRALAETAQGVEAAIKGEPIPFRAKTAWPRFLTNKLSIPARIANQIIQALKIPADKLGIEPFEKLSLATPEDWMDQLSEYLPIGPADFAQSFAIPSIRSALKGEVPGIEHLASVIEVFGGRSTDVTPFQGLNLVALDAYGRNWDDLDIDQQQALENNDQIGADVRKLLEERDEKQREGDSKFQAAEDQVTALFEGEGGKGGFRQQQESLDLRLVTGTIDYSKYKDEERAIQIERSSRNDQIYADSDIDFDALPETDPRQKPIRAALSDYWSVDIDNFTNPDTLEIDFDGYQAERLSQLDSLNSAQREVAIEEINKNKTTVQLAEDEARDFVDENEPAKYRGLSKAKGEELDDFRNQVSRLSADFAEEIGSVIQQDNVAVALAQQMGDNQLYDLYRELASPDGFKNRLTVEWVDFWTDNRTEEFRGVRLQTFFPWRYDSQSDKVRFDLIEERPEFTGGRVERVERAERVPRRTNESIFEEARDAEELRLINEAINSGKIPITTAVP